MESNPDEGEALPCPFEQFADYGIKMRRGQVSLIAAASGGGKSMLTSHISVHSKPKIPTLYFSADTDKVTLGIRITASLLNITTNTAEQLIRQGDPDTWSKMEEGTEHIWFCWDANPSLTDVKLEVEAYAYATGAWPHLIVIDNLINVDPDGEASHIQKDTVMHWLQGLANYTNAHVCVLHHVTGEYEDGLKPIPKSGLLDKVAKRPRLVLTLYRVSNNLLGVRVVKNSSGKMDPSGNYGPDLAIQFERAWMKG